MKRNPLIMLIVVVVSMCFISEYALAAMDSNHVILLKKELKYDTWDPEEEGRRVPSKPISCVITPSGIIIDGVNTAEIYLIVVCDINDGRIYEFTNESDFI